MTTSIDLSVDELLLLQDNQSSNTNFLFTNIKPIGAERKIGLPTNVSTQKKSSLSSQRFLYPLDMDFVSKDIIQENKNSFEIPSFDSTIKPSNMSIYDQLHFSPIDEPLLSQTNNEIDRLTYHSFHNYSSPFHQRQISNPLPIPSFSATQNYSNNRFSSQYYSRNPFVNICQQTRSIPPIFSTPLQRTRERFQVNSIGRPILRTNNYNHLSQVHQFKIRR